MSDKNSIEYTQTVKTCIDDIATYLNKMGLDAKSLISNALEQFEMKASQFPLSCPICPELVKIGVSKYRECNTSGGYRVLYSVEGSTITAHAILAHRQDVQQLLFKRMIQA